MGKRRGALGPLERAERLAARQHGVITRRQGLDAGLTRAQVDHRLATGSWRAGAVPGVLVLRGAPRTSEQTLMAACLAGPPGTVASHLSAAALLGLTRHPRIPHVTVPPERSARAKGAVVHRSLVMSRDRAVVGRVPCTGPARTLVDCAAVVTEDALEDLVDTALCRFGSLTARTVLEALARVNPDGGRKGAAAIRRAVRVWATGVAADSPAEMRLFRRLEEWGLPLPERQFEIRDEEGCFVARVDAAYPDIRFALEYEGDEAHTPRGWKADDARAGRVRDIGWRIEQVYKEDLWPWSSRLRKLLCEAFGDAERGA